MKTLLCAAFIISMVGAATAGPKKTTPPPKVIAKAIITEPAWYCVGRGYVAMVPRNGQNPLIVVRISEKGIEPPETFSTAGNEVRGLQCAGPYIELFVHETDGEYFSLLPFVVKPGGPAHDGRVEAQKREEINASWGGAYSTPPDADRRIAGFYWNAGYASGMRGDWYVDVDASSRPGYLYEVHFAETENRAPAAIATKLTATFLEEDLHRKVLKSVPLMEVQTEEIFD